MENHEKISDVNIDETQRELILSIKDLHKSYNNNEVLKGINIDVYKGEVFGFIGRNGAGKSTTIDSIVGLKNFDLGTIVVNGFDVKKNPIDAKKVIGYVASEPITYESMTGYEYLRFIASSFKVEKNVFNERVTQLGDKFLLSNADLKRKIREYSLGMKQKICLIASLIHDPLLWILDEPTVGLDIIVYQTLMDTLSKFAKEGKTVFITSHNIDLVSRICNRVAVINNGVVDRIIDLDSDPDKRNELNDIFLKLYGIENESGE